MKLNDWDIWYNVLKYLISGKTLEVFLLSTYLIPPNSSATLQTRSAHGNPTVLGKKAERHRAPLAQPFQPRRQDQIHRYYDPTRTPRELSSADGVAKISLSQT